MNVRKIFVREEWLNSEPNNQQSGKLFFIGCGQVQPYGTWQTYGMDVLIYIPLQSQSWT